MLGDLGLARGLYQEGIDSMSRFDNLPILPSFGVISEVIACFSRKRVFGYDFVAFSSIAIGVFGQVIVVGKWREFVK